MNKFSFTSSLVAAVLLSSGAFAQTQTQAPPAQPAVKTDAGPKLATPHWRSSKMIGLAIYNEQNERLGDINEILLDASGKVLGYVVGVGGFLGMGEHDIFVEPSKIKFVNEPARTAGAPTRPANSDAAARKEGDPMTTRSASSTATRAANEIWYPDHGVMTGNKDQLKAMPQFKYSNYN